jgi:D-cysteine desulfhydrase family pyridoxal phosphate-dependent enzyme
VKLGEAKRLFLNIPKVDLGFFPTPLHKLNRLSEELGVNLYIKRDDFTGIGLYGGNKIRKLQYLIADAISKKADYVFTYGATQSNHAMQTATACRRCGIKPVLFLMSIVEPDKELRGNLLIDKLMGAEINILRTDCDLKSAAKEHMLKLEKEGYRCYEIPGGAANGIGSAGYAEGYLEMAEQAEHLGFYPDYIFHATGSNGTAAGLIAGRKLIEGKTKIVSVCVADVGNKDEYAQSAANLTNSALQFIGVDMTIGPEEFYLEASYYGQGYEIPTKEGTQAIKKLAMTEGILVDPVYSGKAFSGMLDYIASGKVPQGGNVVFWHTGGTTALFAEKAILGDIY